MKQRSAHPFSVFIPLTPFNRFARRFAAALIILAGAAASAPAQQQSAPGGNREQQLQQIEQKLENISKQVQDLKTNESAESSSRTASGAPIELDPKWINALPWRSIGPANMGGRVVDFAVVESDPTMYWVATAGGGLLKTTNNGVTFVHQFDHENTVAIGSVCVAPSNPDIVWVGTGENNPRNSVSYGDGVYKSTDGGRTWKHMGLTKSFQIGRIVIDHKDPNIVYVGALGRLYGPGGDRGVYKTTDGGETWNRVLYVDEQTGVVDVQMNPADSDMILVATWERTRDGFDSHPGDPPMADGYDSYDPIKKWGPGSGLFKTTDGGKNWHKLTNGLPTSNFGRIGLDFYRKNPKEIFAIVDCEKIGMGAPPQTGTAVDVDFTVEKADNGLKLTEITRTNGAAAKAGLKVNDILQSLDGKSVTNMDQQQLTEEIQNHKIGDKVKFEFQRVAVGEDRFTTAMVTLERRPEPPGETNGVYAGLNGESGENGLKITAVADNGPASRAGVKEGDIVQSIGDKAVSSEEQLTEEVGTHKAGDVVKLKITRDDQPQEIELTLAERPANARGGGQGGRGGGGQGGQGGRGGSKTRPSGANLGGQMENVQDQQGSEGWQYGGIYKSTDGGESWTRINSYNPRPMYFSLIKVDPTDDRFLYVGGVQLYHSTNSGKIFRATRSGYGVHADQHALWIDPRDGRHMLLGCDGGFYASYDRSANWDHLNLMDIGQFYHVAISLRQPYYVAGGLQDNGSWFGPSRSLSGGGPINEDWMNVGGGDGFVCRVDPNDPDMVYSESQDGAISRRNVRTGERGSARATAPRGKPVYRFNWNTPYILSSHNSRILYSAGNYVFRSLDRGNNMEIISPEITLTKHGSGTALAESPMNADVLYAGTDDGALWITRDGGKNWTNITENVGLAGPRWVSSIEPSRYVEGRAYVAFDCHRSDEDDPCIYVTEDFGKNWKPLRANLPMGSSRVLREDIENRDLLFLGTEFGAWFSLDRGQHWNKFGTNFPTVCVMEFAFYPSTATPHSGEVVVATHGRSLWVLDATTLRQIKPEYLTDKPALYRPAEVVRWRGEPQRGVTNRKFEGANGTGGAQIFYSLPKEAEKVSVKIVDINGTTQQEFQGKKTPGLYAINWNLSTIVRQQNGNFGRGGGRFAGGGGGAGGGGQAQPAANEEGGQGQGQGQRGGGGGRGGAGGAGGQGGQGGQGGRGGGGGGGGGRGGLFGRGANFVPAGTYRIVLNVDGQEMAQVIRVEPDPVVGNAMTAEEWSAMDAQEEEQAERLERGETSDKDSQQEMRDIRDLDPDRNQGRKDHD